MDFRFFKAVPEASIQFPVAPMDREPNFAVIVLERTNDPDALNHTGFDYLGACGTGSAIDAWAAGQPVTAVPKNQLPNPLTFYPAIFNEA
jgi:hypothetical protein